MDGMKDLHKYNITHIHPYDIANLDDVLIPDLFSVYDNNYVNISYTDYINVDSIIIPYDTNILPISHIIYNINDENECECNDDTYESVSIISIPDILDMINYVHNYISINNIDNSEILCQQLLNIKSRVENCFLLKLITTKQIQITNYCN